MGGEYLARIWSKALPEALLWTFRSPQLGIYTQRITSYIAPSWSWACLEAAGDSRNYLYNYPKKLDDVWVTVQEAACTPAGKDPFGVVSKGHIELIAPALEVSWFPEAPRYKAQHPVDAGVPDYLRPVNIEFSDIRINTDDIILDFDLENPAEDILHCIFFGSTWEKVQDKDLNWPDLETYPARMTGLLLRKTASTYQDQAFERLGVFRLEYSGNYSRDKERQELYLKLVDFLKTSS